MSLALQRRKGIKRLMIIEKYQCSFILFANLIISYLSDLGVFTEYHFMLAHTFSYGLYPCIVSLVVALYMRKCWWEYGSIFGLIAANIMGVLYFHFNLYEVFIDMYSTAILLSVTVIVTVGMLKDTFFAVRR